MISLKQLLGLGFCRAIMTALLAAALLAVAVSAAADGLDSAGRAALSRYKVTKPALTRILAITRAVRHEGLSDHKIGDLFGGSTVSIQDLVTALQNKPALMKFVRAHGINARDFIMGNLALKQSALAAKGGYERRTIEKFLGQPNPANTDFYQRHAKQINALLGVPAGNQSVDLARLRAKIKAMHTEKFRECVKIGLGTVPVVGSFGFAAGTTHSTVVAPPPGGFTHLGKILEDLSANVADPTPADALQRMGLQIELQEGRRPAQVTPKYTAAANELAAWMKANCPSDQAKNKEARDDTAAPAGPATVPKPVAKVATDAQGAAFFGQLSATDAAILHAARGIQLGDAPGPADIQVIFDPNAPYGAKLYQQLRNKHRDLAVRWVPIAYFAKNSAALASVLLNSRDPQKDLDSDLRNYDFARHQGGVQPGGDHHKPLSPAQHRLYTAWAKWGGYSPMIVFRDKSGRWLRTGGSSEALIDSVIARAME